jgi:hypothetical protein
MLFGRGGHAIRPFDEGLQAECIEKDAIARLSSERTIEPVGVDRKHGDDQEIAAEGQIGHAALALGQTGGAPHQGRRH